MLEVTRDQILAFRRTTGSLDVRLPAGQRSLRKAALAGLQDSMPRAALLSLHARVEGIHPASWEDPALVQVWGPRYSAFVVAADDIAPFTLGRLPTDPRSLARARDMADRLRDLLGDEPMTYREAGRNMGVSPNALRYAAPTGTVLLRWEGAGKPVVRSVPPPEMEPGEARRELARRYLHVFGPSTAEAFGAWAGVKVRRAAAVFEEIGESTTAVGTPIGDAVVLTSDVEILLASVRDPAPARLLPSGDAYYLRWGTERELLVEDPDRRDELWTSRVWPGAVLVEGEIVGVWRRTQHVVTIEPWIRLAVGGRNAVEAEVASFPIPGVEGEIEVRWDS